MQENQQLKEEVAALRSEVADLNGWRSRAVAAESHMMWLQRKDAGPSCALREALARERQGASRRAAEWDVQALQFQRAERAAREDAQRAGDAAKLAEGRARAAAARLAAAERELVGVVDARDRGLEWVGAAAGRGGGL